MIVTSLTPSSLNNMHKLYKSILYICSIQPRDSYCIKWIKSKVFQASFYLQETRERMKWKEDYLDLILVPSGLLIMLGYHLLLLYKCMRHAKETAIGFENHCIKIWVNKIMQIDPTSRGTVFTVISSNTTAATFMASTSLTLTTLIGTWVGSSSSNTVVTKFIYGDKGSSISTLKYVSVIGLFLVSFVSFVNSTRCFVHANFLLSMPQAEVPVEFVEDAVLKGQIFWQLGLRAVYFATTLLMWVFGPIPMFVASVITVMILRILDANTKPLHEFPSPNKNNLKVGEEISAVAIAVHRHERTQEIQTTA